MLAVPYWADPMGNLLGFFLFARPSFLEGVARIIDVGNTLNEYSQSPDGKTADALALRADWRIIGDDLRMAMKDLEGSLAPKRLDGARQ